MSDRSESKKRSWQIKHRFRVIPNYEPYRLFRDCVLRPTQPLRYPLECPESAIPPGIRVGQVKFLQTQLQQAYMRVFNDNQKQLSRLVFDANCVPAGVKVMTPTQSCNNAKACVWCFARRRLFRMRDEVLAVAGQNPELKLFCWYRDLFYTSDSKKLEFYGRRNGPHQWFDAALTIQTMLPYLAAAGNEALTFRHVIVQLTDVKNLSTRFRKHEHLVGTAPLKAERPRVVDNDAIRELFQWSMSFNWEWLYAHMQRERFKELLFGHKRAQLLRINYDSKYKPMKGKTDGEVEVSEQAGEEAGDKNT